jgi:hypothetical protein
VIRHQLVPIRGDAESRVARSLAHGFLVDSESLGVEGLQSGQVEQMSTVSSGPLCAGWRQVQGVSHALSQSGNG